MISSIIIIISIVTLVVYILDVGHARLSCDMPTT